MVGPSKDSKTNVWGEGGKSTLWGLFEVFNEGRGDESQLQDHPLTHTYRDASAHIARTSESENPPTCLQSKDVASFCQLWDFDILG